MESYKAKQDFSAALEIIEDSINKIKNGKTAHIRPISTQLYILLIDRGNGIGPLVSQFIPDFQLHPIFGSISEAGRKSPLDEIHELLGPTGF